MRFITGLIIGVLLTVGSAYVVDSMHAAPGPDHAANERMVNWEVVSANMRGLSTSAQDAWAKIVGGAKELDKKTGA